MKPIDIGYASMTEDLMKFKGLCHMPMELNVNRLDGGDGIEATLMTHSVQWHNNCRSKFNRKMFLQQSNAELASELTVKLFEGYVVAIEVKYHRALYNKIKRSASRDNSADWLQSIAFSELGVIMEDMLTDKDKAPSFILSDLANLYTT